LKSRQGADVAPVLRDDRRIEHADAGLADVVDARRGADHDVARMPAARRTH